MGNYPFHSSFQKKKKKRHFVIPTVGALQPEHMWLC